jgi:hypothetical protein
MVRFFRAGAKVGTTVAADLKICTGHCKVVAMWEF